MATKTISIDLPAYEKLRQARLAPAESFSQVIHRAHWDEEAKTCAGLLSALSGMPAAASETIKRLERAQREDSPPDNPRA